MRKSRHPQLFRHQCRFWSHLHDKNRGVVLKILGTGAHFQGCRAQNACRVNGPFIILFCLYKADDLKLQFSNGRMQCIIFQRSVLPPQPGSQKARIFATEIIIGFNKPDMPSRLKVVSFWHAALTHTPPVSSIYIWSENLVAESEAKDGGN